MAQPHPARSNTTREGHHGRHALANDPPFNHSRRSWTDNGVQYTMDTASYSSPGFSFSATTGSAGGLLNAFQISDVRNARERAPGFGGIGTGLLGTAVNLLGAMTDARHAGRPGNLHRADRERQVQLDESDESDYESDLAYGEMDDGSGSNRRRTMFTRLKDKLNDNRQRAQKAPPAREPSPAQRARDRHQRSYRDDPRRATFVDLGDEDYSDYEAFDKRHQRSKPQYRDSDGSDMLQALQQTRDLHQAQVKQSRKNLERASRQRHVDIGVLQALLNEVKSCERSLARAEQNLQAEHYRVSQSSERRSQRSRPAPPPPRDRSPPTPLNDFEEYFATPGFSSFPAQPRAQHPLFVEIDRFHTHDPFAHLFGGAFHRSFGVFGEASPFEADLHNLFGIPSGAHFAGVRSKRPRFSSANSGPRSQPGPSFVPYNPPPSRPPPTLLQPDEAGRLFKTYNDRWNALAPTDPNIPFPSRGLQAPALLATDTLWAPSVSSPVTTWSEETVMQANAQAFYLGVVGLAPAYTEIGGRVTVGFDKARAGPVQVKQLVDVLKKEKVRWHSDRLGRRNSGRAGTNEALQNDPRARAVFHAVCELMEAVQ